MRKYITYKLLILLMMLAGTSYAQVTKVEKAYEYLTANKIDSAKITIDEAMAEPVNQTDFQAWYIKGFVYKEIYKLKESTNVNSPARDIATEALKKAIELDISGEQKANMVQNLKFLSAKYNNDAVKLMDTVNYTLSEKLFEKYIGAYTICEPQFNANAKRLEFYLAISYKLQGYFEESNSSNLLKLTELYLEKALKIDPNSATANKNYALLYYNMGVKIIKQMDYDVDLEQLYKLQEQTTVLLKKAEPLMLKAYQISPNDPTILEGLSGIYYQLNDIEKSNFYKQKLDELHK